MLFEHMAKVAKQVLIKMSTILDRFFKSLATGHRGLWWPRLLQWFRWFCGGCGGCGG